MFCSNFKMRSFLAWVWTEISCIPLFLQNTLAPYHSRYKKKRKRWRDYKLLKKCGLMCQLTSNVIADSYVDLNEADTVGDIRSAGIETVWPTPKVCWTRRIRTWCSLNFLALNWLLASWCLLDAEFGVDGTIKCLCVFIFVAYSVVLGFVIRKIWIDKRCLICFLTWVAVRCLKSWINNYQHKNYTYR